MTYAYSTVDDANNGVDLAAIRAAADTIDKFCNQRVGIYPRHIIRDRSNIIRHGYNNWVTANTPIIQMLSDDPPKYRGPYIDLDNASEIDIYALCGYGTLTQIGTADNFATFSFDDATLKDDLNTVLSDNNLNTPPVGTIYIVTGDWTIEIIIVSELDDDVSEITGVIRENVQFGETSSSDGGEIYQYNPPEDLRIASTMMAKRWTQMNRQPGAGAFLNEMGVPQTQGLTYQLTSTLASYRKR